jgi:hypothetical protein
MSHSRLAAGSLRACSRISAAVRGMERLWHDYNVASTLASFGFSDAEFELVHNRRANDELTRFQDYCFRTIVKN